jgi:hypothetical protein
MPAQLIKHGCTFVGAGGRLPVGELVASVQVAQQQKGGVGMLRCDLKAAIEESCLGPLLGEIAVSIENRSKRARLRTPAPSPRGVLFSDMNGVLAATKIPLAVPPSARLAWCRPRSSAHAAICWPLLFERHSVKTTVSGSRAPRYCSSASTRWPPPDRMLRAIMRWSLAMPVPARCQ